VAEELKDPAKRQPKAVTKEESKSDDKGIDVDEEDYVPASNSGTGSSEAFPSAQREQILKEIAAFRERSNKRERNKTWYEEEDKIPNGRDRSPSQADRRRREKSEDRTDKKGSRTQETIPSGPAADRRRPREYHQGVKFRAGSDRYDRDEDDDIPDDELERRRLDRKRRDLEAAFIDVMLLGVLLLIPRKKEDGYPAKKCAVQLWRGK
jgi:hypothetical protein